MIAAEQSNKAVIVAYNCIDRLNDRHEFERNYRLHHKITAAWQDYDLFAISDAVIKRG
jgi:hypothetical protein